MSKDFKRSGIALVICAPSGTGKTTLVKRLVDTYKNFAFSVSCTTRQPRDGEVDGKDYHFITKDEFVKRREAGFFAEWAEVYGNFYGTPLEATKETLANGYDLLFDIDVQGAKQLHETLPGACFVFILPPSRAELERRLNDRGTETPESLRIRLDAAAGELAEATWFDFLVVNDDLELAWQNLETAYRAAVLKSTGKSGILQNLLKEWY